MPKKIYKQTTFNGGEISPRLYSRIEVDKYDNSLETATNCFCTPHGPLIRRNGTEYIAGVKTNSKTIKLVRFQLNKDVAQILEFGDAYIRFYTTSGQVSGPYELASPYAEADLPDITYVQNGAKIYLAHPDHAPRVLTRTADNDWSIDTLSAIPEPSYEKGEYPNTTCTPAATTGSGVNFTAGAATFLDADVGRQIVNISDGETGRAVITSVTSSTVAVCEIIEDFTDTNAIAANDWYMDLSPICDLIPNGTEVGSIITLVAKYQEGTYGEDFAISGITNANPPVVTTSASHSFIDGDVVRIRDVVGMTEVNGNIYTVQGKTATTVSLYNDEGASYNSTNYNTYSSGGLIDKSLDEDRVDAFRSTDVGRFILMNNGVVEITSVVSANEIQGEVLKSLDSLDRTGNWTIEDPTWDATRGYPRAVGIFQERLCFGGTAAQPQTLWFSETGIFDGFGRGSGDDDAIDVTLSASTAAQINWMATARNFIVGTSGTEHTVDGGGAGAALTPSSIRQEPRSYRGAPSQIPIIIGSEVIFFQNSLRKVRSFRYDFNIDGYVSEDLTFLAEHITEGNVKEIAYAQEPDSQIYVVLDNGDMVVATYQRDQKVLGWTKYTTDGEFENVQTITSGDRDEVWVCVKRTINGSTVRYIERFDAGSGTDRLDGFSDSYLTYSDPYTITGITKANPGVVTTSAAHGYSNGDKVKLIDVGGMTEVEKMTFIVANKTSTTFELTDVYGNNVDTSGYTTYTSGGESHKLVTTISGLTHLEAATVQIKSDGATHTNKTVSSGSITLDRDSYEVVIGLPYTTTIKTLSLNHDIGLGSMRGQRSRHINPILEVYRSTLPTIGDTIKPSRSSDMEMDQAVDLYSGFLEYGTIGWNNTYSLTISVSDPLPLQLLGIFSATDGGVK